MSRFTVFIYPELSDLLDLRPQPRLVVPKLLVIGLDEFHLGDDLLQLVLGHLELLVVHVARLHRLVVLLLQGLQLPVHSVTFGLDAVVVVAQRRQQRRQHHVLRQAGLGQVVRPDARHTGLLTDELEFGLDQRDAILAQVVLVHRVRPRMTERPTTRTAAAARWGLI